MRHDDGLWQAEGEGEIGMGQKRQAAIWRVIGSFFLLWFWAAGAAMAAGSAGLVRETVPLERVGIELHLERYQLAGETAAEPILLVHGVTYSSHEFDVDYGDYSLARFLAQHGFEVWLLDIAGFGQSGEVADGFLPDSDYAAEDVAAAVRLILARHGLARMDVLGWSWGTVTSGRFAARHPELVKRLVLYAPIVAGLGEQTVTEPFHENSWQHAAGDFQLTPAGAIDPAITEPAVANTYLANCWRYDQRRSPNGGRRDLCVPPQRRLIPTAAIQAPVLLIAGSRDPYVSPALCREAFGTLQNPASQLAIIEGGAHAMLMEKPCYRIFRERVLAFLWE